MVGGWGLAVYLLQYLWQNFVSIVKEHQAVAVGKAAVVVVVMITFLFYSICFPNVINTVNPQYDRFRIFMFRVYCTFILILIHFSFFCLSVLILCHFNTSTETFQEQRDD